MSAVAHSVRKTQLVLGIVQMLVCCIWGLFGDAVANRKHFLGAHHQFAHNGELQLVLALVVPYLALSDTWLRIFNVALVLGTWSNPLAYCVAAITDHRSVFFQGSIDGIGGRICEVLLGGICLPTALIALGIAFVGAVRYSSDEKQKKTK
jgi:hypothetical protein